MVFTLLYGNWPAVRVFKRFGWCMTIGLFRYEQWIRGTAGPEPFSKYLFSLWHFNFMWKNYFVFLDFVLFHFFYTHSSPSHRCSCKIGNLCRCYTFKIWCIKWKNSGFHSFLEMSEEKKDRKPSLSPFLFILPASLKCKIPPAEFTRCSKSRIKHQ